MIIANEFTVSAPIDKAWALLTDLEEVAPLMPGAQLVGREGDEFLGKVKLKVGPVNSEFNGKAHFIERDETQHKALIDARGKESRGTGNAAAVVTLQLHEAGDRTRVTVDTDLKVVGKLAQFGSGMLQQVSEKLLGQFVDALEVKLAGGPAPVAAAPTADAAAAPAAASAAAPKFTPTAESEPIDLLELAGGTSIQKYAGLGVAAVALLLVLMILRRRHHTEA
ncbi:MAG: SRPBCC family protein [Mycobacterium sp.]